MPTNSQNKFYCVNLLDFLALDNGEEFVNDKISSFSSLNNDVEEFLKNSAVQACKLRTSSTYFVFENSTLVGYFTLAIKILNFPNEKIPSKTKRIISRFGTLNKKTNCYEIPAVLIAQISKNYSETDNVLFGDTLIELALSKITEIFRLAGGKTVFLECEKIKKLLNFYEKNNFVPLGTTKLSKNNKELLQLYRII